MSFRFGILTTYPPTQCGLATFSGALLRALRDRRVEPSVVSIVDHYAADLPDEVIHQWVRGSRHGARDAAAAMDDCDAVIIQHEYGIFPGRDGVEVLDVIRGIDAPVITVLHTVLTRPSTRQRVIAEVLARHSAAVVTMTHTGRERLIAHYDVDPAKVHVIPHGAADIRRVPMTSHDLLPDRPAILTWGLLGDGKGIEWAIEAFAHLRDLTPRPMYYVVGQTHPRVLERHGDRYRHELVRRVEAAGVGDMVHFDARYLGNDELHRMVRQADIVLLPYDSEQQVTSGVLIEAVAAGKPVVSTPFPHAVDLLSGGAGVLVDRRNPAAIASALRRVLTEPELARRMATEAERIAPSLLWPAVADAYLGLAAAAGRPTLLLESA